MNAEQALNLITLHGDAAAIHRVHEMKSGIWFDVRKAKGLSLSDDSQSGVYVSHVRSERWAKQSGVRVYSGHDFIFAVKLSRVWLFYPLRRPLQPPSLPKRVEPVEVPIPIRAPELWQTLALLHAAIFKLAQLDTDERIAADKSEHFRHIYPILNEAAAMIAEQGGSDGLSYDLVAHGTPWTLSNGTNGTHS